METRGKVCMKIEQECKIGKYVEKMNKKTKKKTLKFKLHKNTARKRGTKFIIITQKKCRRKNKSWYEANK